MLDLSKKIQNNLYKYVHKTKGSHSFKIKERYNDNVATKTKKEIEIIRSTTWSDSNLISHKKEKNTSKL